ncbi:MAG: radical SAM family heme chaperone HemW [Prolixibacteraceae bacterium]|nr:radical SAM family heme chaperone HemW [Prolixibacteraceae bacterium]
MSGIYIHVPFCKQRCGYCDFYKSTDICQTAFYIEALKSEISFRAGYLDGETISTIYLGGGTPSLLAIPQLEILSGTLHRHFSIENGAEITIEANPDDLSPDYLQGLRNAGFNRLSIGVQSFSDEELRLMNRRHNARQALAAVDAAWKSGFDNICIDLIFGLPNSNNRSWRENLETSMQLPVKHLSAYHITYHEETSFFNRLKSGIISEITEEESVAQFEVLLDTAAKHGFEHYEISNFARDSAYSRHNSKYWFDEKYLGLGPSAHSYNRISRRWNIADLGKYCASALSGEPLFDQEILTPTEKMNDYLLTRIRTKWGVDMKAFEKLFGEKESRKLQTSANRFIASDHLHLHDRVISLTRKGIMISDEITANLLME